MARVINTVAAYRSLLQEEDNDLKEIGVRKLLSHINLHWIDIANDINLMYIQSHAVNPYMKMSLSQTDLWLLFSWLNSIST